MLIAVAFNYLNEKPRAKLLGTGRIKGQSFRGQANQETKPRILTCAQSRKVVEIPVAIEPSILRERRATAEVEKAYVQEAERVAVDGPPEVDIPEGLPFLGNEMRIGEVEVQNVRR